ncbi:protein RoBo-1-like [Pelobates fuscus]|uniref:protein RoBo-1-like n=1 Tax=Pelobates fuscus TaxID=191477 RepID=UPI002FE4C2D1
MKPETIIRNCFPWNFCNMRGSYITFGNVRSQLTISCCFTDNCTTSQPTFSAISNEPNGLVCRSCTIENNTQCPKITAMNCTGNEKMCVLRNTTVKGPKPSSKLLYGCATKSICEIGKDALQIENVKIETKCTCTGRSVSLYSGFSYALTITTVLTKLVLS